MHVGLWGYGRIAAHHATCLNDLGTTWSAAARSSGNRERARADGARSVHGSLDDLVSSGVDALVVTLPVASMADGVIEAVRHGLPVLAEKPVGLSPAEGLAARDASHDAACPVMVATNRRFYGVVRQTKALVEAGRLLGIGASGPDRMHRILLSGVHPPRVLDRWLFANVIHVLDLVRYLGGDIDTVHALRRESGRPHAPSRVAVYRFASGAVGHYAGHFASPGAWGIEAFFVGRRVVLSPLETGTVEDEDGGRAAMEVPDVDLRFKPGLHAQMTHFLDGAARGGATAFRGFDLDDHLRTLRFIEAIHEAPGDGR